ncbi:MAG: tRNA (adenosine(37)-N6)-threonylcarbamoyltransferase complex dimerization subunit type 1 TsaB [Planctomycetota bacterium]
MRIVVLETSSLCGEVAIADENGILATRVLTAARKHARDLIPEFRSLLANQGWPPGAVDLILVNAGPGSDTGLRVGIMTAKTMAYATGAKLVAPDAPSVLAADAPADALSIRTIIDGQQGKVYSADFQRKTPAATPLQVGDVRILAAEDWCKTLAAGDYVTGPALARFRSLVPSYCHMPDDADSQPTARGLYQVGYAAYLQGHLADPWTLEPLYLRPSSAEEKWDRRQSTSGSSC